MRILITTPLSGVDIGGPTQYAPNLAKEFEKLGHQVKIISYGKVEKILPIGLRHICFFLKILASVMWADRIITLDTFSVGMPSVLATILFNKKIVIRIGGDFLWESYVERTGEKITLKQFNSNFPSLNLKEQIIFYFTKILIRSAYKLAFNTEWQKSIWQQTYSISHGKSYVVRNYIPDKNKKSIIGNYFLWAGRKIKLKNVDLLKELSKKFEIEIVSGLPHSQLQEKIKNCYAVVLPSFSEVCPNFILEAVSYDKPFIMTKETGLKEICDKGGIFVDPFDKKALKQAILDMLNIENYKRYKTELQSLSMSHSWQTLAKEFISLCQ